MYFIKETNVFDFILLFGVEFIWAKYSEMNKQQHIKATTLVKLWLMF